VSLSEEDQNETNAIRLQRAMAIIEGLQAKLASQEKQDASSELREPIAIVSMACRFPGGADSPEAFWELLSEGRDVVGPVPSERWDSSVYEGEGLGKIIHPEGGFLPTLRKFDPSYFGITPREAQSMDPQQRLLLEVSWEAIYRLGVEPSAWSGCAAGVYVGMSSHDYAQHLGQRPVEEIDPYLATGNSASVAAGRLSYLLGLTGPSLSVDTSCSSSLVSVHLACQSLRQRDCEVALAGGVNCLIRPELSIAFSQAQMLSPTGRCRTFSADADGFVRAEGCGMIVLKRFSDAQAAGDAILATIEGSAINHDGKSGGLTVPHGPSQQAVIKKALADAQVGPEAIHYLETHGTGTQLGDPVELNALAQVFAESHAGSGSRLKIGSLKTNLGHMEAAAGIGGLIKVVLSMQHRALPPHLHVSEPSPHVSWEKVPLEINQELTSWSPVAPSMAGVSSFGFSGTNAHLILARADEFSEIEDAKALPAYERHDCWVEVKKERSFSALSHPWLGERLPVAGVASQHFVVSSALYEDSVWQEHQVFDHPVMPAVGYLELARAALREVHGKQAFSFHDVSFTRALSLKENHPLQVVVRKGAVEVLQQNSHGDWDTSCELSFQTQETEDESWSAEGEWTDLEPAMVYDRLAQQGVSYGSEWRRIETLRVSAEGGLETVLRGSDLGKDFAFHPLLLDACVQAIAACFLEDHKKQTFLPEGVGKVIFHADHLRGEAFKVRGRVRAGDDWVSADFVISGEDNEELFELRDFRLRPFSGEVLKAGNKNQIQNWFYQVSWPPEELPKSLAECASPEKVADALRTRCEDDLGNPVIEAYREGLPVLEKFAASLAHDCVRKVDAAQVTDEQKQLWNHLQAQQEPEIDRGVLRTQLLPHFKAELALIERCAAEIPAVLIGEQDPLEVLFPEGDSSELTWLYQKSEAAQLLNRQSGAVLTSLREELGRPLRILEVGAGTGGTTSTLLPLLGEDDEYVFSDVSPFLVDEARRRFSDHAQVSFEVFDLEDAKGQQARFDLIVAANIIHATSDLERSLASIQNQLSESGYLLLLEGVQPLLWLDLIFGLTKGWWAFADSWREGYPLLSASRWHDLLASRGWQSHTITTGELPQAVMLAKRIPQVTPPLVFSSLDLAGDWKEQLQGGVNQLLTLVQETVAKPAPWPALTLVTQGAESQPEQGALWGLSRTIELEYPELKCRRIDLDPAMSPEEQESLLEREITSGSRGGVRFRNGRRFVARLQRVLSLTALRKSSAESHELKMDGGEEHRLQLVSSERSQPKAGEIEIRVQAAGLNFIDSLDVAGMLPFERGWLGVECAGQVVSVGQEVADFKLGDQVMALAPRSFRDYLTLPAMMATRWPEGITNAEAAATLPVNGLTAMRALQEATQLKKGERILIHAGSGGTGMAAIQLAKSLGAKVYATASRPKWAAVECLGVEAVFDSRTLDFADQIKAATGGEGVEVVLNSLSGEYIEKGLSLLTPQGRFIELGKRGVWSESEVTAFRSDVLYRVVDLFSESETRLKGDGAGKYGDQLFEGFFKMNALPCTAFPLTQAERAVQYFQRARHIGKVVLSLDEESFPLRAGSSYLITGGAGGLGIETAKWMLAQGAEEIHLISRRIPEDHDEELEAAIEGGKIIFSSADVSDRDQLARVVAQAQMKNPLRGVIHAAGVLQDGMISDLTWDEMETVLRPKAYGAWYLHELTQELPLDFFLLYSSAASLLGSPGQGSHVAANAFLDSLAHYRRGLGLPAQSINWGAWANVGAAASQPTSRELAKRGVSMIHPKEGIQSLALALRCPDLTQLGVIPVRWEALEEVGLGDDPFFTEVMRQSTRASRTHRSASSAEVGQWEETMKSLPPGQREAFLIRKIREELARVMGLPEGELPATDAGFFDLGVDSLMSVDLKNRLGRNLGLELSPTLIFQHPTINQLAKKLVAMSGEPTLKESSKAVVSEASEQRSEPESTSDTATETDLYAELKALEDLLE